eukprot:Seg2431.4 transcript_id=Seg2431.4/GoldUCD/mRNA.D3Y31 product="Tyrosyl-DNA phosphodiesterase 1" protein_id=Seg2431.4/GoldUCD/D3Y31
MAESSGSAKRVLTSRGDSEEDDDQRQMCKYGEKCYRKNPEHFKEYRHPKDTDCPAAKHQKLDGSRKIVADEESVPFLLTSVRGIPGEFNEEYIAVGIKDILSSEHGELQASAQFNYMFDIPWLMQQYPSESRDKRLLIVHGENGEAKRSLEAEGAPFNNIELCQAKLSIAYGTHHSKMMFLLYKDGMKVVIHTANIIGQDWDKKTQGVWISPKFAKTIGKDSKETSAPDKFKKDLLEYLDGYGTNDKLGFWKKTIREHDMTNAKVRIVASVPGRHTGMDKCKWGHLRLRDLLQQIGPKLSSVGGDWPVVAQFSSIGSLGADEHKWLYAEWLQSLSAGRRKITSPVPKKPKLKLVFPTVENVIDESCKDYKAGGSLPYGESNAKKQQYLLNYFHQWKSSRLGRSRASPHIKTYTRISPDDTKAAWFLVTSANLSKAAWGAFEKNDSQLMIRSYEIGVLMLPHNFSDEAETFRIAGSDVTSPDQSESSPVLQLPYDLPLTPYSMLDSPWVWDRNYTKVDSLSGQWMPRR